MARGLKWIRGVLAAGIAALGCFPSGPSAAVVWQPAGSLPGPVRCVVSRGQDIWAGTDAGVFRSTSQGDSWSDLTRPNLGGGVSCLLVTDTNRVFVGTRAGMFRWAPESSRWEQVFSGPYEWVKAAVQAADGELFLAAADSTTGLAGGIFRSADGLRWEAASRGLIGEDVATAFVTSSTGVLQVATNGGGVILRDVFYTWSPESQEWGLTSFFPTTVFPRALACDGTGALWAPTDRGVIGSTDGGVNWTSRDMFPNTCNAIAISDPTVFVGTNTLGVFRTEDGVTWAQMSAGLPENPLLPGLVTPILSLCLTATGRLLAGTRDHGVYRTDQPVVDAGEPDLTSPAIAIEHVDPHPVRRSAVIEYRIATEGRVSLSIFDAAGRRVEQLFEANRIPGHYRVSWSVGAHRPGVYFCELRSETGTARRKLMVVR